MYGFKEYSTRNCLHSNFEYSVDGIEFICLFVLLMLRFKELFVVFILFIPTWKVDAQRKEALLVLPGFGSRINGLGALKRYYRKAEMPVFVARYISRNSIQKSVKNFNRYYQKHHLAEYKDLHVMAYIIGSWTLNQWIIEHGKGNIKSILYDRSPLQERAPTILMKDLRMVNFLLFGKITQDLIDTPYPVVEDSSIIKGIFIETYATNVVRKHQKTALSLGPINWNPAALQQPYTDVTYIPMNHDQMYTMPQSFGSEVFYFIRNGHFSPSMKKNEPVENPFIKLKKR